MISSRFRTVLAAIAAAAIGLPACTAADTLAYDIGGPLEGPVLPLFPTQHGEEPGYPGCIPELAAAKADGKTWDAQGMAAQRQLYPGSVENWRAYWFKYLPVRSLFDSGSLLQAWPAEKIARAQAATVEQYAAPVFWIPRHSPPEPTGRFNPPVPVLRWKPGGTAIDLDCGELPVGVYVVRVIGAVETKELAPLRKPLYVTMAVDDGPAGETSEYRLRAGYVDEIYSVVELYFHAPAKRRYRAALRIDADSSVPLLVQSVDLHDALAGATRRPVKKRATLFSAQDRENLRRRRPAGSKPAPALDPAARRDLDARIWSALPPVNTQFGGSYGPQRGYHEKVHLGAAGKTLEQIDKEYGGWRHAPPADLLSPVLLVHDKLKLQYTTTDLASHAPLPDPYPFKDRGTGLVTPASAAGPQQEFAPIGEAAWRRMKGFIAKLADNAQAFHEKGDAESGWTAAVQVARLAWQYPTLDWSNHLHAVISNPGGLGDGTDLRCRRREFGVMMSDGKWPSDLLRFYDLVYDVIPGNQPLADSIGRFVPWVKSPEDVIELIDVHLVQQQARQVLRYQLLFDNDPTWIAIPAAVLADNTVTEPWMNWLFSKAYIYPNRPVGLEDILISGNDRTGIGYIGSFYYGLGEQAMKAANLLQEYVRADGLAKFDLADPRRYPKVHDAARFPLECRLAGWHFPRIGDVAGPDKVAAYRFESILEAAPLAWTWTREPRFAYILKNYVGRTGENDAAWAEIEAAAAKVGRAPWLDLPSRDVPNWFAALETGHEHDDYRFRASAMVRMGLGHGHQHDDTLDLQVTSMGLPATIDAGQRPGYGTPSDGNTKVHNLVHVDNARWSGQAWTKTLTDAAGARYLHAAATPPKSHPLVRSYDRQVALVDGEPGAGSRKLTAAEFLPTARLDAGVTPPTAYVFDVVRVAGGRIHTHCFHGPLEDELTTNLAATKPYEELGADEQDYVSSCSRDPIPGYPMTPLRFGGTAPAVLQATWRMIDKSVGSAIGEAGMTADYFEGGPRKYTRLHLFGQEGASVISGWYFCKKWNYGFNNLYTQQRGDDLESVFPAVIEPYAGTPFIKSGRLLAIEGNESDSRRAVAVELSLASGRTDLLFADLRPGTKRAIEGGAAAAGEFAFVSRDARGLRQATLTGGTLLEADGVRIRPASADRSGVVTAVDYAARTLSLRTGDAPWPAGGRLAGRTFEIGAPGRMTAYTLRSVEDDGAATTLAVTQGAQFYLSAVRRSDPASRRLVCAISLPMKDGAVVSGLDRNLVASNEDGTRFWRATYLGRVDDTGVAAFELDESFSDTDFGPGRRLRLWEYGVGDTVRQSTTCSLRRLEDGVYEWTGDVDAEVALAASRIESSLDGTTWRELEGTAAGRMLEVRIAAADTDLSGRLLLRAR